MLLLQKGTPEKHPLALKAQIITLHNINSISIQFKDLLFQGKKFTVKEHSEKKQICLIRLNKRKELFTNVSNIVIFKYNFKDPYW